MPQNTMVVANAGVWNAAFKNDEAAWAKLSAEAQQKLTPFLREFGGLDDAFETATPNPSGVCPKLNNLSVETTLSPAATKLLEIFVEAAANDQHNIAWLKENFSSAAGRALEVASGEHNSGITAEQLLQWIELRFETDTQLYGYGSCSCDSSDNTYESKARLVAFLKEGNPWSLREHELGDVPDVRTAFGTFAEIQGTMGSSTWQGTQQTTADIFNVSGKKDSWRDELYMNDKEFSQIRPQAAELMMTAIRNLLDRVQKREAVKVDSITW